jgi:hypothetical protein
MTAVAAQESFAIGRVINRLFGVLGRNLWLLLLLSVLLVGLPTAAVNVAQLSLFSVNTADPFGAARLAIGVVAFLVSIASNAVLQGAVIHVTVNDLSGRRPELGESLAVGLRYFLPLLGISLIAGIGCFIGAIFFIIPGVLLALALSVAAPAEVMERTGVFGALGRSFELTRNNRGSIFVLGLAYIVVMWIVEMVVGGVVATVGFSSIASSVRSASATPGQLPEGFRTIQWLSMGLGLVVSTLLASLSSVGVASIYFELRQVKEGVGAEQLAAVFD